MEKIRESLFVTRRQPRIDKFFNNAPGKIGKQTIQNRLKFTEAVKTDWLRIDMDDSAKHFYSCFSKTGNTMFCHVPVCQSKFAICQFAIVGTPYEPVRHVLIERLYYFYYLVTTFGLHLPTKSLHLLLLKSLTLSSLTCRGQ